MGKSSQRPDHVVELVVASDSSVRLRIDGTDKGLVTAAALRDRVREAQQGDATTPVVISADRSVKYESVVKVMDTLQRAGIQRVGLSVQNAGS